MPFRKSDPKPDPAPKREFYLKEYPDKHPFGGETQQVSFTVLSILSAVWWAILVGCLCFVTNWHGSAPLFKMGAAIFAHWIPWVAIYVRRRDVK